MKVLYDDYDGIRKPFRALLEASFDEPTKWYSLSSAEKVDTDLVDENLTSVTITSSHLIRNKDHNQLGVDVASVESFCRYIGIGDELYEVDYFLVMLEDIEEVMQLNLRTIL
ncbi:hypothetical protein B0H94_11865 [Salsuginibacillus halophilus]|uniref:Uncharacterized protein n=1 Tax=Salsuginibacillus halophilus TaxID=517424 RepID=A0A2P8H698_9BACI|nr:hypothetical protein [Salsuginibacillus halophilus]PSL41752.1 hypothetical protein B0H94_11865 [Salsuginibacillus halophilus]